MAFQFDTQPSSQEVQEGSSVSLDYTWSGQEADSWGVLSRSNQLGANIERVYDITVTDNGNIYACCGFSDGSDCKVFESTDGGVTFSEKWHHPERNYITRIVSSGNDLHYVATSDLSSANVYKNGVLKDTFQPNVGATTIPYGMAVFSNGNIAIGYGDFSSPVGGGKIRLSTDGGESYTDVFQGFNTGSDAGRITCISIRDDGITGFAVDKTGFVYKTTDSGATWAQTAGQVRVGQNNNSIGILPNGELISGSQGSGWVKSTDDAQSWSSYTGPANAPFATIKNCCGATYFSAYTVKEAYVTTDGVNWQTLSTTDADITAFFSVGMNPDSKKLFIGSGANSGDGYVYSSENSSAVYGRYLKDTVEIDTFSTTDSYYTYSIGSMSTGDAGDYQLEITNGGNTILSDVATLSFAGEDFTNEITDGITPVKLNIQYGYTTEIALSIERALDANGKVQWIDNGQEYDNYSTSITARTTSGGDLENLLSGTDTGTLTLTNNGENWPFSMVFQQGQDININVDSWSTSGDDNIFGDTRTYTLEIVPRYTDIYSNLTQSGVIPDCTGRNHWQIGSVQFPFADWDQVVNDRRRVNVYGGSSGNLDDTKREYGDVSTMTINCDEEQARKILQFFVFTMRGTEQTAIFPAVYRIFGERYKDITTCKVKLFDNILTVTHVNKFSVNITFSLQMVGV